MKFILRIFAFLFLTAIISSCAGSSKVLFSDDFSSTKNKWDQVTNNNMTTDYYNNAYRILVNLENYDAWANPDNLSFTDVQVEVDATKNAGPDTNDFGIVCRYTGKSSYYYAVIGSDGFYSIYKKTAQGATQLGLTGELFSDKILKDATNHLRFDCVGSTLTLYANGYMLEQQTDSSYPEGNVGLISGTYTGVGVDILFDNFFVYQPTIQ